MKKVLLSLLAVAALVLSCQNYDDEFAALNAKVASLESQITSLSGLQTALTQVQSSVSALQAAVSAIPDLSSEVAAILADLESLASDVAGATTSADLDALKAELNTSLAALQALIEANSASIANLVASNTELKDALEQLGVDVDSVLAANATFEGNLTITNDAELAYAKSLGIKVATIKGDVYVKVDAFKHTSGGDGTGLAAAEVNDILSKITYVVGNVKIDSDESLDLSSLASVTGDYIVIGHDISDDALLSVGGDVHFDHDGAYISKIQTAGNIFLRAYDDADAAKDGSQVALVGTTSIDFLALTKATGVQTVSSAEASAHTSGASLSYGSTEADKIIVTSPVTASVKIGQAPVVNVTSGLTAALTALTTVELHYAADKGAAASGLNPTGVDALASLSVSGVELSSITVKAAQITGNVTVTTQASTATSNSATLDLSSTLTIGGKLDSDANTNTLTKLKSVSGLRLREQKSVSLPALTKSSSALATGGATLSKDGSITLDEATSLSAPLLATVGAAKTSTVAELRADITANNVEGTVSLPALVLAGDLSFTEAEAFDAIKADIRSIDLKASAKSVKVKTVTLPLSTGIADLNALEVLELHGLVGQTVAIEAATEPLQVVTKTASSVSATAFDGMVDLTTLTVLGYAAASTAADVDIDITTTALIELTSVTVGGALDVVNINTTTAGTEANSAQTKLASITTSGTIRSLTVENNFDLTSLTLGHTEDLYASGASNDIELKIINNKKLNSFTTSQTMAREIVITGNNSLSSFDLSSISKLPSNVVAGGTAAGQTNIVVQIYDNHLAPDHFDERSTASNASGAATAAQVVSNWDGIYGTYVAQSNAVGRVYGQSSIATLSNLVAALDTEFTPATGTPADGDYPDLDWQIAYKYQSGETTVGDIVVAQAAVTINGDGSTGTTGASVNPTIASLNNATLLAEMKKFE